MAAQASDPFVINRVFDALRERVWRLGGRRAARAANFTSGGGRAR